MPEHTRKDRAFIHLLVAAGLLPASVVIFHFFSVWSLAHWIFEWYYRILALALLVEFVYLAVVVIRSLVSKRFRNAIYATSAMVILALIPVVFLILVYANLAA